MNEKIEAPYSPGGIEAPAEPGSTRAVLIGHMIGMGFTHRVRDAWETDDLPRGRLDPEEWGPGAERLVVPSPVIRVDPETGNEIPTVDLFERGVVWQGETLEDRARNRPFMARQGWAWTTRWLPEGQEPTDVPAGGFAKKIRDVRGVGDAALRCWDVYYRLESAGTNAPDSDASMWAGADDGDPGPYAPAEDFNAEIERKVQRGRAVEAQRHGGATTAPVRSRTTGWDPYAGRNHRFRPHPASR